MLRCATRLSLCVAMLAALAQVSAAAQERLLVRAGGDHKFPPYEFLQDGKPTGFNIDLINALAAAMNFDVEIHLGPWNQAMEDLREGRLDVLTGMAYSEERSDDFDFTIPHTMISPALFVHSDSDIHTLTDIAGKEIIVQQSDIMHEFMQKEAFTSHIISVADHPLAFRLFAEGKHDGVLLASAVHKDYIARKMGYENLRAIEVNLMPRRYCLAVKDGNRELLSLLDRGLILLKSNGTYSELHDKWFGSYEKHQWWLTIRYYVYGLMAVATGLGIILLWSWTLRSKVAVQTAALLANEAELKKAQGELEKRVQERTEELASANVMLNREVDERRKVEKALRKSEAEYRAIVESFDGQIYICSSDYRIEFMNASLMKRTGRDATGEPCYRVLHDSAEICPWCINERVLAGETVRWEVKSPKDNRWYYIVNTPIYREDGSVSKQAVILDVTDRVRAEEEKKNLETQNRRLQKAESLGRMAAAIAHHFNNKLHVVIGCLDTLLSSRSARKDPEGQLRSARQAAEQAAEVSRLMLTYLGRVSGRREPLDLAEICKSYLSRTREHLPENITLNTNFTDPGPGIEANSNQLQVLLGHLLTNATEAIGAEQGTITITVDTVLPENITTANTFPLQWRPTNGQYACLEISDDGIGMAAANIEAAFDPFYSTKFTGRGMGLSVVQGIAQAHGGAISVESNPEKGSTFRFFCPLVEKEKMPVQTAEVAAEADESWSGTVLIVDDDRIVLEINRVMLTKLGFTVLAATEGREAVEIFRQRNTEICLILSDIAMPNMNGMELLQAVRGIDSGIPVILASGYSEEEVVNGQFRGDYQAFLEKPFSIVDLKKALRISLPDHDRRKTNP